MFTISTAIVITLLINLECGYSCHVTVVYTIMFTAVVLPPCTLPLSRHRARRFWLSSGQHLVANNERAIDRNRNGLGVGRDSSVGIATRFGLFGPGMKFRRGRDFPHPSGHTLGRTQRPVQRVPALFPGGSAAGTWR